MSAEVNSSSYTAAQSDPCSAWPTHHWLNKYYMKKFKGIKKKNKGKKKKRVDKETKKEKKNYWKPVQTSMNQLF